MAPSVRAVALCCELKHASIACAHKLPSTLTVSLLHLNNVCCEGCHIVRMEWFFAPVLCGNDCGPKTYSGWRLSVRDDTQGVFLRSTWVSGRAASLSVAHSLCLSN